MISSRSETKKHLVCQRTFITSPPLKIVIIKTCISELRMSSAKVGLGLGARGLKDKDWGPGVSDPYVVISR